jgi:ribosome-associated protein
VYINDSLEIDEGELDEQYTRASGPGGQHVNKTESAVQLRFNVARCEALSASVKSRLVALAANRMTKTGVLVIRAEGTRSQERNRIEARDRLKALIIEALTPPKIRKKSRPSLASKLKQKAAKAQRGKTKSLRKRPSADRD